MFEERLTDTTSVVAKGREEDWNQLGAGLGIKNINGGTCSTAGIASKNGNYFILTAAHCFAGQTSSTGEDLIRQYNTNVGRQHAIGRGITNLAQVMISFLPFSSGKIKSKRMLNIKETKWELFQIIPQQLSNMECASRDSKN